MDSLRKHFPWMTETEEVWLRAELLRRAAAGFEQVGQWSGAAECWATLHHPDRAARLYARSGDLKSATSLLLSAGRYAEALELYCAWEVAISPTDVVNRVRAWLGQAACHNLGARQVWASNTLSARAGLEVFRRARELIEIETARSFSPTPTGKTNAHLTAARCWAALGEYGAMLGRQDLVQQGFEQALVHFEATEAVYEKIGTGRAYLEAIHVQDDHALSRAVADRLMEWREWETPSDWERQRQIIEAYPFRNQFHDVVHFTGHEQWGAWSVLAEMEGRPEVDEYLRSLAPEGMVYIPAGSFLMGSEDDDPLAQDIEKPQHVVWLRGYYIDCYPVTNAQYREFIEAGGYQRLEYWQAGGWARKENERWTEPRYWRDDGFTSNHQPVGGGNWYEIRLAMLGLVGQSNDDQPVVGLSWYEAAAYACWAGKVLPSEAEWEKAAGWDPATRHKRRYPWGDNWDKFKSNSGFHCQAMTEVGYYSGDVSYYGMGDVAGNVEEWCNTRWNDEAGEIYVYPYDSEDGREDLSGTQRVGRVIKSAGRFGSLDHAKIRARCGYRDMNFPWVRSREAGFRCVVPHTFSSPDSEVWVVCPERDLT